MTLCEFFGSQSKGDVGSGITQGLGSFGSAFLFPLGCFKFTMLLSKHTELFRGALGALLGFSSSGLAQPESSVSLDCRGHSIAPVSPCSGEGREGRVRFAHLALGGVTPEAVTARG